MYQDYPRIYYRQIVTIGQLKDKTFKTHFYSKILVGTPKPLRGHHGAPGHVVGDPCSMGFNIWIFIYDLFSVTSNFLSLLTETF
jgi:hypothetical protein